MFEKTCSKCGAKNPKGHRFCAQCGERMEGGKIKCGNCGKEIDSGTQFCGECGKPITESEAPTMIDNKWARKVDDFATKVEVSDLTGVLKKELIVEQGTKALLFIDGAFADTLIPGKYNMGSISDKLKNFDLTRRATAVLVDAADVRLEFRVIDIWTKDPVKIDVTCNVVVQLSDPNFFFVNMMKGRQNYSIYELKDFLFDEIRNALRESVGQKSVKGLSEDLSLKKEFETRVETHLRTTYQRNGISFIQFQTIDYIYPHIDKIKNIQEELFLQIMEKEAKLEGRKRFFDVVTGEGLQDIIEETKKVEHFEKRAEIWARMRSAVNSDKMNNVRSEDELEAFMMEVDKGKILRKEELDELKRTFAEKKEDHELARQHLLRKMEMEQSIELYRLELVKKEDLDPELIEMRLKKKRMEYEAEIAERQARDAADREEALTNRTVELEIKLKGAQTDAEIAALEREQDRLDVDMALMMKEKLQAQKLKQKREEMLLEIEEEERRLEMRLKEKKVDQTLELERLSKLSDMSIEALIVSSPSEQAKMLAELKNTETLKGMTDDQILAMGAKDSPELAKAFQEKFKAMSAEQQKLYERMLADKDKSSDELRKTVMEMFKTSMEAFGSQRQQPIVVPGSVPGQVMPPGTSGKVIICTKCHTEVPAGQQYCNNCGNQMF